LAVSGSAIIHTAKLGPTGSQKSSDAAVSAFLDAAFLDAGGGGG
jgi:hypothetical protein